nr:type II toxin-antitoxin system RelE/ParE family toxin [uncultured Campylobacter sp.]
MWEIDFVNEKAMQEFDELPPKLHIRAVEIVKLLKEFGNQVGEPHTAPLQKPFFEIRVKSAEGVARSIYCYQKCKKILILVTAVKKQNKLPKSIMEVAKNRLKEYENGNN